MAPRSDYSFFGFPSSPKASRKVPVSRLHENDPYDVLGIPRDADANTIKSAYRRLSLKHHPDKVPILPDSSYEEIEDARTKASSKFAEISSAYEILSDLDKKNRYDHILKYSSGIKDSSSGMNGSSHTRVPSPTVKRKSTSSNDVYPFGGAERPDGEGDTAMSGFNFSFSTSKTTAGYTPDGMRQFVTTTTQYINGRKSIREETIYSNGTRRIRIDTHTEGQKKASMFNDGIRVQAEKPEEKPKPTNCGQDIWAQVKSCLCHTIT